MIGSRFLLSVKSGGDENKNCSLRIILPGCPNCSRLVQIDYPVRVRIRKKGGKQMSLVIEEETIERLPINIDPEIMSGTPVFDGTRVPVEALMNNLAAGVSLDEFLENFPTVSREQAQALLRFSSETLRKLASAVENPA
jgi:uncharacterized protein (DUF433 family)